MKLTKEHYMVQSDYIDEMMQNPYIYPNDEILSVASFFPVVKKKLLDSLLIKCAKNGYLEDFVINLQRYNMYAEYIDDVIASPNRYMQAIVGMFLENDLLGELFEDDDDIIDTLISTDEYGVSTTLFAFSKLTVFNIEDQTVERMKDLAVTMIRNNNQLKEQLSKDDIERLVKDCVSNFETNHENAKLELSMNEE